MASESFTEPFRHWVLESLTWPGLLPRDAAELAGSASVPWVRYDNDCERGKRTCNDLKSLAQGRALLEDLNAPRTADFLGLLTGVRGLRPDPTLHGGGI